VDKLDSSSSVPGFEVDFGSLVVLNEIDVASSVVGVELKFEINLVLKVKVDVSISVEGFGVNFSVIEVKSDFVAFTVEAETNFIVCVVVIGLDPGPFSVEVETNSGTFVEDGELEVDLIVVRLVAKPLASVGLNVDFSISWVELE
jgi:hypothetical protein